MRRTIYIVLTILWIIFIFANSFQTATQSIDKTSIIIAFVEKVAAFVYSGNVPSKLSYYMSTDMLSDIRNMAHIFEFFILYLLVFLVVGTYKDLSWPGLLYVMIFCLFIAIIDESIQLFVEGRGFELTDILRDLSGALLALSVVYFIKKIVKTKNQKEAESNEI